MPIFASAPTPWSQHPTLTALHPSLKITAYRKRLNAALPSDFFHIALMTDYPTSAGASCGTLALGCDSLFPKCSILGTCLLALNHYLLLHLSDTCYGETSSVSSSLADGKYLASPASLNHASTSVAQAFERFLSALITPETS
jgi:hypothetical protein